MNTKICNFCNKERDVTLFSNNQNSKDKLSYYCTFCQRLVRFDRKYHLSANETASFLEILENSKCPKCNRAVSFWTVSVQESTRELSCSGCARTEKFKQDAATRNIKYEKVCYLCKDLKSLDQFPIDNQRPDKHAYGCRICLNARSKERRDPEKERIRAKEKHKKQLDKDPLFNRKHNLKHRFKLTWEEFQMLFESQGRMCKICGTTDEPVNGWPIDHDHSCCPVKGNSCGKCIRGILCQDCNQGLGRFKDTPELMLKAIDYLNNYKLNGSPITNVAHK